MRNERKLLLQNLRNVIEYIENEDWDLTKVRSQIPCWFWDRLRDDEIFSRLLQKEHCLESLLAKKCTHPEGDPKGLTIHLLTGLSDRLDEGRKNITGWLSGARKITICDPYFFLFNRPNKVYRTQSKYNESLDSFLTKKLESIEVFHSPDPNRQILSYFQKICGNKNVTLTRFQTTEIHDRVIIKDDLEARVLGTSFGGLGNKIAFILDLPREDLKKFRQELYRIKNPANPK